MAEAAAGPIPMDVMVFGPARSGTTLVADLLTIPGRSVVISEPEIFKHWSRPTAARVHKLAQLVGLDVGAMPPDAADYGRSYARYFRETLAPKLATLERWGIKNVDFSGWRALLGAFPPKRLVLCVRDLRDTAISGVDRICRLGIVFRGAPRMRDEAWVLAGLAYSVQELMAMRELPHLVVRYEDLARGSEALQALADYVGLDRLQEDRLNLKAADFKRAWEIEKHQRRISAASVGRFAAEPPGPVRALAERLWRLLPEYSKVFGYEMPPAEPALAAHDFAAAGRAHQPIDYLQTERWDWAGPAAFEPSFAQRRARIAIARAVRADARAIDLCYGAPSLAPMLPQGAKLIRADAVARGADERIANLHRGELPSTADANLALLAGMLEHVEDLPGLLGRLRATGLLALASYHATDDTADLDRAALGWRSHLGRDALMTTFAAAGYAATPRWAFDGRQSLFRLAPARA
jgi:Sulfotransferase family